MQQGHTLAGLIAWTRREEWRQAFASALERHTAVAFTGNDFDPSDLPGLLAGYANSTVWGAVFEDLVATDLPGGLNLADEYLRRRGWKETPSARAYITSLRHSAISLYEVSDIVAGESMLVRDLIRPGDPVRVSEKSGSRSLRQWDRVATRVILTKDGAVISGTLMVFDHDASDHLLDSLRRIGGQAPQAAAKAMELVGVQADETALDAAVTPELLLSKAAFMFTNAWLDAAIKAERQPRHPEVVNSDGDALEFVTVHFPFERGTTDEQVRLALSKMSALRQETATFWNWVDESKPRRKATARRPKAQEFRITLDTGELVLGNVEIKRRRVSLSVNSEGRAVQGTKLLGFALVGLVNPPLVERTELEQILADGGGRKTQPSGLPPDEERQLIQQSLDAHYRGILDNKILMLGNRSPSAAVKTAKGREKVAEWIKLLESGASKHPPGDPIGSYDFGWMWRELGIEELRK